MNRNAYNPIVLMVMFSCQLLFCRQLPAQSVYSKTVEVDSTAWANNSVNVTAFRKNSLVTFKDTQYIAFYNKAAYVVLGKRKIGSGKWMLRQTPYTGNIKDAHNTISIMVDAAGYLHVSWDHHNNKLNYCKSIGAGSLELTERLPMTGLQENSVTYPEFYRKLDGSLLFFYRDGGSGNGNLVINAYNVQTAKWQQLHRNLIDGEGKRNAYWQACIDNKGAIHVSWVWRERADVASNHDICYAVSTDGGITWHQSTGKEYQLPINAATAEYACTIPQNSELINQTSMNADEEGHPFIATYWREKGNAMPQYHIVYKIENTWQVQDLGFRNTAFSLSGMGTKRIPIARPQIMVWRKGASTAAAIVFRDEERGNLVSVAINNNIRKNNWRIRDLTTASVGSWEPSYDTELWKKNKALHLFVQFANQQDAEGIANALPQIVNVLECNIKKL